MNMARIEKNNVVQPEVAVAKKEIQTEKARKHKPKKWISCAVIIVVVLLIVFVAGLWLAAATGLYSIPLISSVAYIQPQPDHRVIPGTAVEVFVSNLLESEITQRLQAGAGTISDRSINISIPEASFTKSIQNIMADSGDQTFDHLQSQISISDETGFELFMPLLDSQQGSAITINFVPKLVDGLIRVDITSLQVGSLKIPQFITRLAISRPVDARLQEFNRELGRFATFDDLVINEGSISLSGELTVEILKVR